MPLGPIRCPAPTITIVFLKRFLKEGKFEEAKETALKILESAAKDIGEKPVNQLQEAQNR